MREVRCSATMSTVIVCVNCQAGRVQIVDRLQISADMFAHAVGDLDHATRWTMTVPTKANHFQSVRACKVELGRRCDSGMSDLSRHRVLLVMPSSLCTLCVLCVSVVVGSRLTSTTETQRT